MLLAVSACSAPSLGDIERDWNGPRCGDNLWGQPQSPPDPAPYRAAHDCVVDAIQADQPFLLTWTRAYVDTGNNFALEYLSGALTFYAEYYVAAPSGKKTPTSIHACSTLVDYGVCSNYYDTVCVACGCDPPDPDCSP